MSEQVGSLEGVLGAHHWAAEVDPPEGVDPYLWCVCGWRSDDVTDADWRSGEHARLAHAHVAAEVRAWIGAELAGEGMEDAVRRAIAERQSGHAATAALSAVRDHLAGDAEGLGEVGRS